MAVLERGHDVASRSPRRSIRFLSAAAMASSTGDGLASVAFPLLGALVTSDARLVAGLYLVQNLPWLLISLPAGAISDRYEPRTVLV
ncbi:MAG: MFS transporter, partial [Thermoleophilia bacterium]|nr:MFS transporter [Thermoleophilia bacterium]